MKLLNVAMYVTEKPTASHNMGAWLSQKRSEYLESTNSCECSLGVDENGVFVVSDTLDKGICRTMYAKSKESVKHLVSQWIHQSPRFLPQPSSDHHDIEDDAVVLSSLVDWLKSDDSDTLWDLDQVHTAESRGEIVIRPKAEWIMVVPQSVLLADLFTSFKQCEEDVFNQFDKDVHRQNTTLDGHQFVCGPDARKEMGRWEGISTPVIMMCTQAVLGLPHRMLHNSLSEWNPSTAVLSSHPDNLSSTVEEEGAVVAVRKQNNGKDICVQKKLYLCRYVGSKGLNWVATVVVQIFGTLPAKACAMNIENGGSFIMRFFVSSCRPGGLEGRPGEDDDSDGGLCAADEDSYTGRNIE
jgi:hypothetical protein